MLLLTLSYILWLWFWLTECRLFNRFNLPLFKQHLQLGQCLFSQWDYSRSFIFQWKWYLHFWGIEEDGTRVSHQIPPQIDLLSIVSQNLNSWVEFDGVNLNSRFYFIYALPYCDEDQNTLESWMSNIHETSKKGAGTSKTKVKNIQLYKYLNEVWMNSFNKQPVQKF